MDWLEQAKQYFANNEDAYRLFIFCLGAFCVISSIFNWDFVFDGPYNPTKNPIGFWFGRTAFSILFFILGFILIVFNFMI